ncbi:MAG: hypothetical protein DMF93_17575 [Acidobacteria bacterium]|nr:MAG: hypothetical protein DMF93_17575 [Acidobacteriota bacterium]
MRLVSSLLDALMDSFRSAYVRTGMNLAQSIVVVAIDLARRGWTYARHTRVAITSAGADTSRRFRPSR